MLVAVHDQQVPTVGGLVQDLVTDLDAVPARAEAIAQIRIVVTRVPARALAKMARTTARCVAGQYQRRRRRLMSKMSPTK
jgi:hypothetical protein